jgi:hypothetical protein
MTDAELRIIEFLMTSDAARPADLPDWMLALLEGDQPDEMTHELITAASLLYARRLWPGSGFHAARAQLAQYVDDPARLDDLYGRGQMPPPTYQVGATTCLSLTFVR